MWIIFIKSNNESLLSKKLFCYTMKDVGKFVFVMWHWPSEDLYLSLNIYEKYTSIIFYSSCLLQSIKGDFIEDIARIVNPNCFESQEE